MNEKSQELSNAITNLETACKKYSDDNDSTLRNEIKEAKDTLQKAIDALNERLNEATEKVNKILTNSGKLEDFEIKE